LCFNKPNYEIKTSTLLNLISKGIKEIPLCPVCRKKNISLNGVNFAKNCSKICADKNEETKKQIRESNLEKYGTTCYLASKKVKDNVLKKYVLFF
jgi:hypothetical protein